MRNFVSRERLLATALRQRGPLQKFGRNLLAFAQGRPEPERGEYMYIQARASKEYKGVAASLVSRGPSNAQEMVFEDVDVKRQKVSAQGRR